MKTAFKIAYFLLVALYIGFALADNKVMMIILKPLLMPILAFGVITSLKRTKERTLLVFALFFSFCGDVFLMYPGELFFMLGLGSFLIAHVLYIRLFSFESTKNWIYRAIFIIPVFAFVYHFILPSVPENLKLPVGFYVLVITTMGIKASERTQVSSRSYWLVLLGAISFLISDSVLAFNKFTHPINYQAFWVMSTYCLAQFLIAEGYIVELQKKG